MKLALSVKFRPLTQGFRCKDRKFFFFFWGGGGCANWEEKIVRLFCYHARGGIFGGAQIIIFFTFFLGLLL
jgi:hypothetical protein